MSVLQCASVALKATVRELESSKSPNRTRLHTLRQEQMMETLECLLQMGSYRHTMVRHCKRPARFGLNERIKPELSAETRNYLRALGHVTASELDG